MTQKDTENRNLPKIVAQSYEILRTLYHNSELSITEIGKETKNSPANVSRKVKLLELTGYVVSHEERGVGEGGKPRKICRLTYNGQQIVQFFESKTKPNLTEDQISMLLDIFEDKSLNLQTRKVSAEILSSNALSNADSLLKNTRIKAILEQAANDPSKMQQDLTEKTFPIFSALLPTMFKKTDTALWFRKSLYSGLLRTAQDEAAPKYLRQKAIGLLARTAKLTRDQHIIHNILTALIKLSLGKQDIYETAKGELLQFETRFQTVIIKQLRQSIENENNKTKAEETIQFLIKNWWTQNLSQSR